MTKSGKKKMSDAAQCDSLEQLVKEDLCSAVELKSDEMALTGGSPDITDAVTVVGGDTLPNLAFQVYGDTMPAPAQLDPMPPPSGQVIKFPDET